MSNTAFHGPSLYVRASLVEIPEGRIVEVEEAPALRSKPRERLLGVALVVSIVILAFFTAWMVMP